MSLILNEEMSANGVDLVLGDGVTSFVEIDGGIDVKLASGRVITADLVILAIGVRPNSQLALDAGLKCNERGGIIVDSHMRTDDPSIYAAGDVIEVEDFVFGD
jgi:NAD(P)H-nitrite reductase large subunit